MIKRLLFLTCLFLSCMQIQSQILNPVKWRISINEQSEITFQAAVEAGWHLYDMNLPEGGPIPTSFTFEKVKGAELSGKITTNAKITKQYDQLFEMEVRWFTENPTFVQKLKMTDPDKFNISGVVEYMSCDDENCLPGSEDFEFTKKDLPAGIAATLPQKNDEKAVIAPIESSSGDSLSSVIFSTNEESATNLWQPVIHELQTFGQEGTTGSKSWWLIFAIGFGGGLLALLTPCVWPIIPMTVSFFLKRSKSNRKKAVTDAVIYGLSIIAIYLLLGLLITVLFGASALNELSTSAVFNLLFFALLMVFAISFFGAFDLTLPSSWTTRMDNKAESTTGLISIFFMAFTLVLVSFSCTGPIIGTLLVEAAGMGSISGPAIGMFGFALALAIPFALFAIFPSWLQNMPKSGGWLNSVKVVLGFLELALALKFLSVADLAYGWGILDREVFLVLWIILFALLGMYLLGKIKFSHDSAISHVSIPRLFLAIVSLAFTVYMIPGLWGAPLKAISAFLPPLYTQDFSLYHGEVTPKYFDYESGMEFAKKNNKPVLIDFTGYGCVNCREMEASVWSDPRVKQIIDHEYVLISLYVDDKSKLPEVVQVEEFGKIRKLRTVGDKWSYLQRSKFGANAQPFYVLLDNKGRPVGPSYAYDKKVEKYIDFLKKGLEQYQKK